MADDFRRAPIWRPARAVISRRTAEMPLAAGPLKESSLGASFLHPGSKIIKIGEKSGFFMAFSCFVDSPPIFLRFLVGEIWRDWLLLLVSIARRASLAATASMTRACRSKVRSRWREPGHSRGFPCLRPLVGEVSIPVAIYCSRTFPFF